MNRTSPLFWLGIGVLLLVGGCSTAPKTGGGAKDGAPLGYVDFSRIPDAVPRVEPLSRYGNPPSYEVFGERYFVMPGSQGYAERGTASWYGTKFHGQRTSSGEPYDLYGMTAAHKSLPLPTYCEVTNLDNGRRIIVKVNDRGPFHSGRIIDLSYVAAGKLGINGTGRVEVRAIDPRRPVPVAASRRPAGQTLYVQAGAFSDRSRADFLSNQLGQALRQPVRIQTSKQTPAPLHKVQLGPFVTQAQAEAVSMQLARMGLSQARVVAD